jgi:type IV secretion system protein VirD4
MTGFAEWPPAAKALGLLFGAMLLAAVWMLLASTVFLVGTNMMGNRDGIPFLEWWSYFRWYGFSNPRVGSWLKIAAGVATAIPALLILARLARGGLAASGAKSLHGSTRWASRAEMKRAGFYASFAGLYVGKDSRGKHLRFGGPEHVACYAPTRSGKGVGLVIPNCLLYEASLVCLDVKKENWVATAGIREAAGQKVFLFDPLAPDGRTARYNPFTYVRRDTIDAFEDIQRIAQMVFPHVSGDQAFWQDSARSAFVGAAGFLAESPELPLTFGEVLRQLSGNDAATLMLQRIEARRLAGHPYTEATVKALEDYLKGSADLVNSIRKTVTAKLSLWYNPRIDAATAASDFDLRELRSNLHAIYVGVTPDNLARLRPLLALFFQQLVDLQVRTLPQHDPNARHQVLLLLDEFPLLGPMPVLAEAFAFVAGFGIRMMLIMQSKAQLRDRDLYGPDKAEAILDNCGLEVVFGTKDLKLTEELSARIGYDTVEAASRSGPRFWRLFRRDKLSLTESDQRRALLLPQEIVRLKPEEAILIKPGMFPVRAKRIRHYADPLFKRLLRAPPVVPPIDIDVRLDRGPASRAVPVSAPANASATADEGTGQAAGSGQAEGQKSCTVQDSAADTGSSRQPAKRKPTPQKSCTVQDSGTGAKAVPVAAIAAEPAPAPDLKPHQSDSLLSSVMGADIDLSDYGLSDAKLVVAQMIDRMPTSAPARGRRTAAE